MSTSRIGQPGIPGKYTIHKIVYTYACPVSSQDAVAWFSYLRLVNTGCTSSYSRTSEIGTLWGNHFRPL